MCDQPYPTFPDRKVPEMADWRDLLELAKRIQSDAEKADDTQKLATVEINTTHPIAIMYTGDWHLGSHVDYDTWVEDIEYVLQTPELFMIDHGDDIQNMRVFKNLAGVLAQVLSPAQQNTMMVGVVDELTDKNKILAKVSGNHDEEMDERLFGQSIQGYLLSRLKAPRFSNRGLLKLAIGKEIYTNVVYHKSRFSSFIRACHDAFREYEGFFPADIVSGAHLHRPGIEHMWQYQFARQAGYDFGGLTYLIKVGSPQESPYGWKYFHGEGYVSPTVVFYPDQHKKIVFDNPRDAVNHIRSIKGD